MVRKKRRGRRPACSDAVCRWAVLTSVRCATRGLQCAAEAKPLPPRTLRWLMRCEPGLVCSCAPVGARGSVDGLGGFAWTLVPRRRWRPHAWRAARRTHAVASDRRVDARRTGAPRRLPPWQAAGRGWRGRRSSKTQTRTRNPGCYQRRASLGRAWWPVRLLPRRTTRCAGHVGRFAHTVLTQARTALAIPSPCSLRLWIYLPQDLPRGLFGSLSPFTEDRPHKRGGAT